MHRDVMQSMRSPTGYPMPPSPEKCVANDIGQCVSQVSAAMGELHEQLTEARGLVKQLHERLNPILSQHPEPNGQDNEKPPMLPPLVQEILDESMQAKEVVRHLRQLLDRLAL